MSINELDMKVKELRELRRMAEELQAEIDAAQDARRIRHNRRRAAIRRGREHRHQDRTGGTADT